MKQVSREALLALEFVNKTRQTVFLTGKAGTGKTTLLREIVSNTHKNTIVVAPTGIAALNAKGVTIHSFFHLPFATFLPTTEYVEANANRRIENSITLKRHFRMSTERRMIFQRLELLIVDEVSMLRADVLDAMDAMLRYARNSDELFGGVQLLFIGDLLQLPPVVKQEEWQYLKQFYTGIYFFNALCLQQQPPLMIELDKVYRQEDERFIELLNHIRNHTLTFDDLALLNQHVQSDFDIQKTSSTIVLTTHNHKADRINQEAVAALKTPEYIFEAEIVGDFPERMFPMEQSLVIKEGAQVIFTKNDISYEKKYYNGKMGVVKQVSPYEIQVYFPDNKQIITVDKYEWQNIHYHIHPETKQIEEQVLGTFTQYPLRLAWAITVHKSQGLTFERAAIDVNQVFISGQLYVALSRLRSLNGLILLSKVNEQLLFQNEEVLAFQKNKKSDIELQERLDKEQIVFLYQNLMHCFEWNKVVNAWIHFLNTFSGESSKSKKQDYKPWAELQFQVISTNKGFAKQFGVELYQLFTADSFSVSHIKQRFDKSYAYFFPKLDQVYFETLYTLEKVKKQKKMKAFYEEVETVEDTLLALVLQFQKMKRWLQLIENNEPVTKETLQLQEKSVYRLNHLVQIHEIIDKTRLDFEEVEEYVQDENEKTEKVKENTYHKTWQLWQQKKSIPDIAAERKLTEQTVYNHLGKLAKEKKIAVTDVLSTDILHQLQMVFEQNDLTLTERKEQLGETVSWNELRFYKTAVVDDKA